MGGDEPIVIHDEFNDPDDFVEAEHDGEGAIED